MAVPHTQTSGAARLAVVYITVGAIMDVWTALWFIWMKTHNDGSDDGSSNFWCAGLFLTGLTLLIIGLALGRIGRAARSAEAPVDNTASVQQASARAAAAPMAAAPMAAAPAAMPAPMNGQVAAPAAAPAGAVGPAVIQPR